MKIFVDGRMMGAEITRGIGRVIEAILPRLIRLRPEVEWVVLIRYPEQRKFFADLPSVRVMERPIVWYGFREQWQIPLMLLREKPDHVLFFHWNVPLLTLVPFTCFIHDLLLLHYPFSAKLSLRSPIVARIKRLVQRLVLRMVVMRAKRIAVPTNYVAKDVMATYPLTRGRVQVVGEGVETGPMMNEERFFGPPYCVVLGSAYPHKRLDLVLEAWRTIAVSHPDHRLVFVGERDSFMSAYIAQVEREALPRVEFVGSISDEKLWSWLRCAELLVFASDEEGFGLPPLEALIQGCPVLSSDASCLPEVLPKKGVRFFRHGEQAAIIQQWETALREREQLRAEIPEAQAWIRGRHSWDIATRAIEQAIFSS